MPTLLEQLRALVTQEDNPPPTPTQAQPQAIDYDLLAQAIARVVPPEAPAATPPTPPVASAEAVAQVPATPPAGATAAGTYTPEQVKAMSPAEFEQHADAIIAEAFGYRK